MAIGSSRTGLVLARTSSRPVAERTHGAAREHLHHPAGPGLASGVVHTLGDEPPVAGSGGGVRPPAGGAGPSRGAAVPPGSGTTTSKTPTPAPTVRSSQVVRDEQRHPAGDHARRPGKSPVRPSHEEEGQHARRGADGAGEWLWSRDAAPSTMVRSRGASRSTQPSPSPTPAEALAWAAAPRFSSRRGEA